MPSENEVPTSRLEPHPMLASIQTLFRSSGRRGKALVVAVVLILAFCVAYLKLGPPGDISRYQEKLHEQFAAVDAIISLFDDIRARSIYPEGDFYKGMEYSKRTEEHRKIIQLIPRLQSRVKDANSRLSTLNEAAEPVLQRHPELEPFHRQIQPDPSAVIGLEDLSGKLDAMRCRDAIEAMLQKLEEIE